MGLLSFNAPASYDQFFFFNDTATTEIYTLSLHDALPICEQIFESAQALSATAQEMNATTEEIAKGDRKSTRLNSSHGYISYAVFCLKKKTVSLNATRLDRISRLSVRIRPVRGRSVRARRR